MATDPATGKLYWANSTDNTDPIAWAQTNNSGTAGNLDTSGATAEGSDGRSARLRHGQALLGQLL
jgi:hypothetical protein